MKVNIGCLSCDITCLACNGPLNSDCLRCRQGSVLANKVCSPSSTSFVLDTNTGIYSQPSCPYLCQQCYLSTTCKICMPKAALTSSGTCRCFQGYRAYNNSCYPIVCDPSCATCVGIRYTDCTSCLKGLSLGTSLTLVTEGICTCAPGYGFDSNGKCAPCDPTCKLCHSNLPNGCTDCIIQNLTLVEDGTCICKDGYYFDVISLQCKLCFFYCKTCSGSGKYQCLSCRSLADLVAPPSPANQAERYCNCESKYIMTPIGECSWASCDISCHTCMGTSANQCASCKGLNTRISSLNTCECTNEMLPDIEGNCIFNCNPSCLTCSSTDKNKCTSCYLKATLQSDNSCKCKDGYFFDENSYQCILCHYSCSTCSNKGSSMCTSCKGSLGVDVDLSNGMCTCTSGSPINYYGLCTECHPSCSGCDENYGCLACRANAILTDLQTCVCLSSYFMNIKSLCVPCHQRCLTCREATEADCIICKDGFLLKKGICACRDGTYISSVKGTDSCEVCNQTIFCITCSNNTSCTSCYENSRLLRNGACSEPYHSAELDYSVEIVLDQIFMRFYHPLLDSDKTIQKFMAKYLSDLSTQPRVLNIVDSQYYGEESLTYLPLSVQAIDHSPYEWERGVLRFKITPLQDFESFLAIIELKPKSNCPTQLAKRSLSEVSEINQIAKTYLIPTFSYSSPATILFWYNFTSVLLIPVFVTILVLLCLRPLMLDLMLNPQSAWLSHSVMWIQLILLYGFISVEFRGSMTLRLTAMGASSLGYLGITTQLFSMFNDPVAIRNASNSGKFSATGLSPYLIESFFLPCCFYLILWISTLAARLAGRAQGIVKNLRNGMTVCFGIQICFLCGINWIAFLEARVFIFSTVFGFLASLVIFSLLFTDIIMMRLYQMHPSSIYLSSPEDRVLSFDQIDQHQMSYETEMLMLMALLVGLLESKPFACTAVLSLLLVVILVRVQLLNMHNRILILRTVQTVLFFAVMMLALGLSLVKGYVPLLNFSIMGGVTSTLHMICFLWATVTLGFRYHDLYFGDIVLKRLTVSLTTLSMEEQSKLHSGTSTLVSLPRRDQSSPTLPSQDKPSTQAVVWKNLVSGL